MCSAVLLYVTGFVHVTIAIAIEFNVYHAIKLTSKVGCQFVANLPTTHSLVEMSE